MGELGRRPLQVVEIDIDVCPLAYGSAPCSAVLGTTGVRKCYNTYATCQAPRQFGKPLEPAAGPDRTYEAGDTLTAADFALTSDVFLAVDLTIPAAPTGCVAELGAWTAAMYLGFTSGQLVFRVGGGGSGSPTDCAKITADAADFEGRTGSFYAVADVSASSAQLWFFDSATRSLSSVGTATASAGFPSGRWAGTADGALGSVNGLAPVDEDATAFSGAATGLRVYDATAFSPVQPALVKTLRFAENVSGLPKGQTIFPALTARVDMDPGTINLGGADESRSPLGTRETVTVSLQDFTYSDILTDPYRAGRIDGTAQTDEGGYDPKDRGTFFGKLRRRFPYYMGRALRVKDGYVGETLAAMRGRNYVITDWSGPDAAGRVTIEAADILDLAGDDKALCPAPNSGALEADIGSGASGLTLLPEGVGDAEYPASGRAVIGSEIVSFTRSGDAITLTARGLDGTEAQGHSEGDTFQTCFRVEDAPLAEVLRDLIVDHSGVPSSFITFADWQAEAGVWLAGFNLTRTLTKPTGVTRLIGEILQLGAVVWWDGVAQKIRFKANRPVAYDEAVPSITDGNGIIRDTAGNEDLNDQRLTRVIMAHGQLDFTGSVDDPDNYRRFAIATDIGAASEAEYAQERTKWLYMPWLGDGDDSVARPVVRRLLNRYVETPRRVRFKADTKDRDNLGQAAIISVVSRVLQDETGNATPTTMQVTAAKEDGMDRLSVTAETFTFDGRYGVITENGRPDYGASSAAERVKGTYIVGASGIFSDGSGPYRMF